MNKKAIATITALAFGACAVLGAATEAQADSTKKTIRVIKEILRDDPPPPPPTPKPVHPTPPPPAPKKVVKVVKAPEPPKTPEPPKPHDPNQPAPPEGPPHTAVKGEHTLV